jgi:hypothetical protein
MMRLFQPQHFCITTSTHFLTVSSIQCNILLTAMTNVPPVIAIELGAEELQNALISNMLAVFVDVLQRRLKSAHRSVVLLSLPQSSIFSFVAQTGARDVRIVGADFFEQDYLVHSAWNFVSVGDGSRLCAEAMKTANDLRHALKQSMFVESSAVAILDLSFFEPKLLLGDALSRKLQSELLSSQEQVS